MNDLLEDLANATAPDAAAAARVAAVRRRFERNRFETTSRRPLRWVAASVALAVAAAFAFTVLSNRPLSFHVDGVLQESGHVVRADEHGIEVRFDDGSLIDVTRGGLMVVEANPDGAELALEHGRAHLDIRPNPEHRWTLTAGAVRVVVHGTRFNVGRAEDSVTVSVEQGLVSVETPDGPVILLRDGESHTHPPADPDIAEPEEPSSARQDWATLGGDEPTDPSVNDVPSREAPPDYEVLVRNGSYAEAVAQARSRGLDREIETRRGRDLVALGDAARLSGDPQLARRVYEGVVRRFANRQPSATASFRLGRVCADQLADPSCAASAFEAYLRGTPDGDLALDALGRLIETRRARGDLAGARRAAREYLDRYPGGPRGDLARRVLDQAR